MWQSFNEQIVLLSKKKRFLSVLIDSDQYCQFIDLSETQNLHMQLFITLMGVLHDLISNTEMATIQCFSYPL